MIILKAQEQKERISGIFEDIEYDTIQDDGGIDFGSIGGLLNLFGFHLEKNVFR